MNAKKLYFKKYPNNEQVIEAFMNRLAAAGFQNDINSCCKLMYCCGPDNQTVEYAIKWADFNIAAELRERGLEVAA